MAAKERPATSHMPSYRLPILGFTRLTHDIAAPVLISGQFEHNHWPRRQKKVTSRTALPQNTHLSTSSPPSTAFQPHRYVNPRTTTICRPTAAIVSRPCRGSGSTAIHLRAGTWPRPSAICHSVRILPSYHLPRSCCSSRCSAYGLTREATHECIGASLLVELPYKGIGVATGSFISTLAQLCSWTTTLPLGYRESWNRNTARWARLRL